MKITRQSKEDKIDVLDMMKNGDEGVIEINTAPIHGPRIVMVKTCQSDDFIVKRPQTIDLSDDVTIIEEKR